MPNNAMPEGFVELLRYLDENPQDEYKASEIQAAMQSRHSFTSGKVTGIINRAVERGVIARTSRSIYKPCVVCGDTASSVTALCKNELRSCISKIEMLVGQKLTEMSNEEVAEMKDVLCKLKSLAGS